MGCVGGQVSEICRSVFFWTTLYRYQTLFNHYQWPPSSALIQNALLKFYIFLQGDLVFVNYARYEDFELLTKTKGMNLAGKIAIAKYGKIFRGDKVRGSLALTALCSSLGAMM